MNFIKITNLSTKGTLKGVKGQSQTRENVCHKYI